MDQSVLSTKLNNLKTFSCLVCGSTNSKPLFEQFDLWYNRKNVRARYVICHGCGLISQFPQPSFAEFKTLYPEAYHTHTHRSESFLAKRGLHRRCQIITKDREPGSLLDIGCGTGRFMRFIRDNYGWKVCGVEVDEVASKIGRELHDLQIFTGDIDQIHFPDNSFDAVTLWDVLEHIPDPKDQLIEISRILKPEGILVLRLPNSDSWDAKLFGKNWAGYDSPRHFYVFNLSVLEKLLFQTGFSIVNVRTDIGSYPNFVKSIQFTLTGKGLSESFVKAVVRLLSSIPAQFMMYPFTWLKDRNNHGTSIVLKTQNNS